MKSQTPHIWSQATPSIFIAIKSLIDCHYSGYSCRIIMRNNEELSPLEYPVQVENPEINKMENWTMNFSSPGKDWKNILDIKNPTERKLTEDYTTYFFKNNKERLDYIRKGVLPKKFSNQGVCGAMLKTDYLKLRPDLVKSGWEVDNFWTTDWKLRDGVSYRIPAPIGNVFLVEILSTKPRKEVDFSRLIELTMKDYSANIIED